MIVVLLFSQSLHLGHSSPSIPSLGLDSIAYGFLQRCSHRFFKCAVRTAVVKAPGYARLPWLPSSVDVLLAAFTLKRALLTMSTTPRLLSAVFASGASGAVLAQNGDRVAAALQRLFARPDDANAALLRVLERLERSPAGGSTVIVREGGGAGRVVVAGACVAGVASCARLRWMRAALQRSVNVCISSIKAVGARLEAVRETLSKRLDEVGEKVDVVGEELGEVHDELKEVHANTAATRSVVDSLSVKQDHIARGVRGLCGVVSELMNGSATPAVDDLRRFAAAKPPIEAPERTADENRLATTTARLAEALAAMDALGAASHPV